MYVCTYVYMHAIELMKLSCSTYLRILLCIYMHTYAYTCIHVHWYVCVYKHTIQSMILSYAIFLPVFIHDLHTIMYVCMYVFVYIFMKFSCPYTYMVSIQSCMYVCMYLFIYLCNFPVRKHTWFPYVCMYACMYICIYYMYVCLFVCMYAHIPTPPSSIYTICMYVCEHTSTSM
jgi:hypothetical protein